MSDTAFSIDINPQHTRICDAHVTQGKIELLSLGYDFTTPHYFGSETAALAEAEANVITNLYTKLKIKKKNVNVVISDEFTFSQIIEMPKLKEKELLAAIRYQADEFIPMPIDDTNLDLEILHEDPTGKKLLILIMASPKKMVAQIQRTIELANLIPDSLENNLSSVGRLFSDFVKPKGGSTVVINIGYDTSSIYLIDNVSSLVLLVRTFRIGINLFIRDLKVNLNWEDAKIINLLKTIGLNKDASYNIEPILTPLLNEIFREIEKFIILAKDRYNQAADKIYLFNFDNQIANLAPKMQAYFGIPAQPLNLAPYLVQNPVAQSFSSEMSSFISVIAGSLR